MTSATTAGLSARFMRGLTRAPQRIAFRVGGLSISYEQAHELALSWAGTILASPSGPHAAIGILADKGAEAYAGVLAALYSGATVVPLHVRFPAARTRQMIEDSGVSLVIADERGLAALAAAKTRVPAFAPGQITGNGQAARPAKEPALVSPSDVAYILFTSGSTGRPKGVPLTYGMIEHYFATVDGRYDFTEADVFSQTFELGFDCAMFDLFCAWGAGATVLAMPETAYRDLPGFIGETGLTVWFSAPSVIALARKLGGLYPGSLPSLRWSLFAGEALRAADVIDWTAAAPGGTVENLYGPTELTLTITGHRWSARTSPALCVNGLVPIGTPHEGHEYVLLADDGKESGDEGELCVRGPQLAPGYLNSADNAGRFTERAGHTWYLTGDRVRRLPNGELIYLGRLDSQVQLNGLRVELTEVEHALRGCPGVDDAVAVARPGENGLELITFYTGVPAPPATLARRLRDTLPAGMMPRHYQHLDEFPLNSNRKVDRKRLAEADPGPAGRAGSAR
jgi:amino acid adenylation domain-containing protein